MLYILISTGLNITVSCCVRFNILNFFNEADENGPIVKTRSLVADPNENQVFDLRSNSVEYEPESTAFIIKNVSDYPDSRDILSTVLIWHKQSFWEFKVYRLDLRLILEHWIWQRTRMCVVHAQCCQTLVVPIIFRCFLLVREKIYIEYKYNDYNSHYFITFSYPLRMTTTLKKKKKKKKKN